MHEQLWLPTVLLQIEFGPQTSDISTHSSTSILKESYKEKNSLHHSYSTYVKANSIFGIFTTEWYVYKNYIQVKNINSDKF